MKYFLDTSFLWALIVDSDTNHEKAAELSYVLNEECFINNNVLNEILTITGRRINIDSAREIYYNLIDSLEVLNEYEIANYTSKTFKTFEKHIGVNSKKTKLCYKVNNSLKMKLLSVLPDRLQDYIYYKFLKGGK